VKFTIMRLPPLSPYFAHVTATYSPKQSFLEHPPPMQESSKILRHVCWYVLRRNKMSLFSGSGSSGIFFLECLTLKMEFKSLLGCDVVSLLYSFLTFLTDVVFSSSGFEGSRKVQLLRIFKIYSNLDI
jgi:hypothetical protein